LVAYNPELNGRAERRNQMHMERSSTILKDSQFGKDLCGEAMSTHIYIWNRCPSSILPNYITPYKRVFGHLPSIGHLHVFGSKCFIKVPEETRTKLDDKALECRLIGFEGDSIYMVVNSNKKKLQSCNVIFVESIANRQAKDKPSYLYFLRSESMHIEQEPTPKDSPNTEDMTERSAPG